MGEPLQALLDTVLKGVEILGMIGGGGMVLLRVGRMAQKFESIGVQQSIEISELKTGMRDVRDVLVTLASQDGNIKRIGDIVSMQGKRLDETTNRLNQYIDQQRGLT